MAKINKDTLVKKEIERLKEVYADMPPDELKVVQGLIVQAARLRVMLDDMWQDIQDKGDVEMFSQSPNTEPYERVRPVAQLFNSRDKAYQTLIKQLADRLPANKPNSEATDRIMRFVTGER